MRAGRRLCKCDEDCVTDGGEAWLVWRPEDSFSPSGFAEPAGLEEGVGDHCHERVSVQAHSRAALEVIQAKSARLPRIFHDCRCYQRRCPHSVRLPPPDFRSSLSEDCHRCVRAGRHQGRRPEPPSYRCADHEPSQRRHNGQSTPRPGAHRSWMTQREALRCLWVLCLRRHMSCGRDRRSIWPGRMLGTQSFRREAPESSPSTDMKRIRLSRPSISCCLSSSTFRYLSRCAISPPSLTVADPLTRLPIPC